MPDQRYAVVIGVDDPGVDAHLPALRYAQRDAHAIQEVLCHQITGTFAPEDVTLLTGAEATSTAVKAALRRIALKADRSDLLLVFFAGHTLTPSWSHDTDAYLVTPDLDIEALNDNPDAGLRMAFLTRDVLPVFPGTTLLILDCCRAGRLATSRGVDMIGLSGRDEPRHAVLAACAGDGYAREDPVAQHGVLTHHVLQALAGRAGDHDGTVTFESMSQYIGQQDLEPQPIVFLQSRGTIVLTRPGGGEPRTGPPASSPVIDVVDVVPLENPLDRHATEIARLVKRLVRSSQQPTGTTESDTKSPSSRVEYLRAAVNAKAVAFLSYSANEFKPIDSTALFDLSEALWLLRGTGHHNDRLFGPRWFGHLASDEVQTLWCAPLGRIDDRLLLLAVIDPPAWLTALGQPGAKVLETIWRADFVKEPAEAEVQVLTSLREAFGRLPDELFERCLSLYRSIVASFQIVFQPVVKIGEAHTQVNVHSYEALARRSATDSSAPFAMLQIAHTWGDHFVVERDKIILGNALTTYVRAHAEGPWAQDTPKPIAVNVSVRSLLDDSYIQTLRELIAGLHLDANAVTLEISEQDAIEPWATEQWPEAPHTYFHKRLASLAFNLGVVFAVDDFGSGYASVSRMAELPLTQIKVDRAILHHRQALQELELVVAVARDAIERGETHTARTVIVEGVDDQTPLTLRQLYKRGIRHIQGHITGERGSPHLRRLSSEMRHDIAARVKGDDENRSIELARRDTPGHENSLRRGA